DFAVPAEEVIAFDRAIGAEDKRMLELVPGVLPLDPTATASVQADKPSVEWRRRLAAAVAE
ncbi:MAG: Rieske (2Fe-2S) protein, partial [Acidimicrobiales bacterium]